MIWRSQKPSKIDAFVHRNSPSDVVGTPGDNWRSYLKNHGGRGETMHDLESSWLDAQNASLFGTPRDKIGKYIASIGYTVGDLRTRTRGYLESIVTGSYYLLEDGTSKYLLEDGSGYYILE